MSISYLQNQPWSSWTRDERFFCSILFFHAKAKPNEFADWLIQKSGLDINSSGQWDLGYEVCFYRDYFWQLGNESAATLDFPTKRTFDLCLFGERDIIIIEAKCAEGFSSNQNEEFGNDKNFLKNIQAIRDNSINIYIVALCSSKYSPKNKTMETFNHKKITWADVFEKYNDDLLQQADNLYSAKPKEFFK